MLQFVNKILALFGVNMVALPALSEALLISAKELILQVDSKDASGEYKRAQVLRALMNRHPGVPVRNLALAIEVVICSEV